MIKYYFFFLVLLDLTYLIYKNKKDMILTKEIEMRINNRYVKYYKDKGYNNFKGGDNIIVDIKDLPSNSHVEVECKCDNCDSINTIKYYNYVNNISNGGIYLCKKCKNIKTEKTNMERYGVKTTLLEKNTIKKGKETTKEKYGVEHYSKTKEFKDKMIEHNLKNYGVEQYFSSDKVKNDRFEKFGVEYFSQTEQYKEQYKNTILEKYGVEHYSKTVDFKDKIKKLFILNNKSEKLNILSYDNDIVTIQCDKGHIYEIHKWLLKNRLYKYDVEPCIICNPINSNTISGEEIKLTKFINDNYSGRIINSDRKILDGKELDIYLPDLNLAFEFNGLYWHNELHKDNNYHLNKTEICLEKGIQLFHIWEDDWIYKQDIIKSMILNKLGKIQNKIFARKTIIKEITDNKLVKSFLDKNHIQGIINSSIKIGLFYNDELVSLMTFGKKRKFMNSGSKDGEFELLRFCNKLNTNVIGGASKLFSYFTKNYNFTEITTYADRSHSQGNLYETLGFNFISKTQPNYYYIIDNNRYFRFGFRKDVLVKEGYDSSKTEHEIMIERGINRIYDSGSLKYLFEIKL
jgi:hypothetical protein